jgi:hypothetical protein
MEWADISLSLGLWLSIPNRGRLDAAFQRRIPDNHASRLIDVEEFPDPSPTDPDWQAMTQDRSELLSQCLREVELRLPDLMRRCLDALMVSLQEGERAATDNRQRQVFASAIMSLAKNRTELVLTYPLRMRQAFANRQEGSGLSTLAGLMEVPALQLVDDAAMSESLEGVRLLQNLLPLVDESLPILDARMSSLIGLESVDVEKNPLRPSVFARELRDLMAEFETDGEVRALWMQHVVQVFGRELGKLYEHLALMLQQANVQTAGYRIRLADDPESTRAAAVSAFTPVEMVARQMDREATEPMSWQGSREPNGMPAMRSMGRASSQVDSSVFHALLNSQTEIFEQPLESDFYDQVQAELKQVEAMAAAQSLGLEDEAPEEDVSAYRRMPAVDRPSKAVTVESKLAFSQWGEYGHAHERTRVLLELKSRAQDMAQAIGLDLVRKLVNQVANDPLLLAPVREAVVALEPALLRLALAQPRYFGDQDHPARCLVEQVAQRSFRHNDEFSDGFLAFMKNVSEAFNWLNDLQSEDSQPFASALARLNGQWDQDDAAERAARDQHLQALKFAETRQELADQIAWEISLRPDVYNAPELVLDFLYASWSLVMASCQLDPQAGKEKNEKFHKAIGTLLWSVRPETLRQSKEAFATLPGLLGTLHEGLDLLGKTQEETQTFFDALMELHQPLLRLRRKRAVIEGHAQEDAIELDVIKPVKRVTTLGAKPPVAEQPWMAAREWADAGFEETRPVGRGEGESPIDEAAQPGWDDGSPPASAEAPDQAGIAAGQAEGQGIDEGEVAQALGSLLVGSHVDLLSRGKWVRAELVWSSSRATLFMFTSAGGSAHSMTRRICEKLVRSRDLRIVSARPVVETAMREVAAAHSGEDGDSVRLDEAMA